MPNNSMKPLQVEINFKLIYSNRNKCLYKLSYLPLTIMLNPTKTLFKYNQ